MKKITFEMLYTINVDWNKETLLDVFFKNGDVYRRMKVDDILEEYAGWYIGFLHNNTLALEEAAQ